MSQRKKPQDRMRLIQIAAIAATGLGLVAMIWFALAPQKDAAGPGGGDYRLETTSGQPFTQATLKGAPSAIFFGYTHCPDVCPTTLGDIATWQHDLGDAAGRLRIFFVTVDPERDTLPVLGEYLSWAEGVQGITGSRPDIDKAVEAFRIYARKVPAKDGGDYTMDHTASVLLFDRDGRYAGKLAYQEPIATALPKLRALIADPR